MDYRTLATGALLALAIASSPFTLAQDSEPDEDGSSLNPDRQGTAMIDERDSVSAEEQRDGAASSEREFEEGLDEIDQPIRPGQMKQEEQVEPEDDGKPTRDDQD